MLNWNKITLYKFQKVEQINASDLSELDKLLYSTCTVFEMTENAFDRLPIKKSARLINKVSKIFSSEFNPKPQKQIGGYAINYDPSKLTFGQWIEIIFFIDGMPIENAHYVLASIVSAEAENHRQRAEYFLTQNVADVMGSYSNYVQRLIQFNNEYKPLFGLDEDHQGATPSKFLKRYGWIYSAEKVAEYERITTDEAFALPIRRALNDLVYLKAKSIFETEQFKNHSKEIHG